jgi:hypothetical protein
MIAIAGDPHPALHKPEQNVPTIRKKFISNAIFSVLYIKPFPHNLLNLP